MHWGEFQGDVPDGSKEDTLSETTEPLDEKSKVDEIDDHVAVDLDDQCAQDSELKVDTEDEDHLEVQVLPDEDEPPEEIVTVEEVVLPPEVGEDTPPPECEPEEYLEEHFSKCVKYPCCGIEGTWEVVVIDYDTMEFTTYELVLTQTVSYLEGTLTIAQPPEFADCKGLLEETEFMLTCENEDYVLALTSSGANDVSMSGFYGYSYSAGGIKNGPFNMDILP
ncbi:hypothetical protein HQ571_04950 [Candidatus Kuenenbacteria bacterium]|nr:hypothetical protein [Candidatus Kuenenbacteria bacterium]